MRKNNLLIATCIFFSLLLFGVTALQAQSWRPQLNSLNEYLKTFDNGYYGYLEVKDSVVYVQFKKGKSQSFRLEEIEDAIAVSENAVQFNCKNGAKCIVNEFTPGPKLNGSGFSQSGNYKSTKELAILFNNFKKAYLANLVTSTKTQPTTSTTDNNTAPDAQLAGLWNITTKDQYGLTDTNKMELKIVNGKLKAWLLVDGKPKYKYNDFSVFKNGNNMAFAFQLKLADDLPETKGSGTVNNDFNRMQGTSLKPLSVGSNKTVVEEWTATKAGASVSNTPVNNNLKSSSNNTTKDSTTPYAQLIGLWNINTKDHRTGSTSNAQMEIRDVNGKLEAWRVVNGKSDIKYTAFSVFKDGSDISYTFELNVTVLKVEGVGKVNGSFAEMKGSQLMSMGGVQFSGDWTATKASVPSPTTTKTQPTTTTASSAQSWQPQLESLTQFLQTYSNGDYRHLEIKDGTMYIKLKNGLLSWFRIEDINDAIMTSYGNVTDIGITFKCKNKDCVTVGSQKYDFFGFASKDNVRNRELLPLFNNFKNEYLKNPVAATSATSTKTPPAATSTTLQAQELIKFRDEKGNYGFKDQNGKEVIAPKYNQAKDFTEGLAAVKLNFNDKYGYIDKTGKEIIAPKYFFANYFFEGLAIVSIRDKDGFDKYGFIDKTGKEVIAIKFDEVEHFSKHGKAKVKLNGKEFYIDKKGMEIK